MAKIKRYGVCKLTGQPGRFVDSHIIPLSLTRLDTPGERVIEVGIDAPKRLRYRGWYDNELVTRTGEDILAKIDSDAIEELRRNRLIWSGLSANGEKQFTDLVYNGDRPGFRLIGLGDARCLRLFFISLAWRAAATSRSEFGELCIDLTSSMTSGLAS